MFWQRKRKPKGKGYDASRKRPVIRQSICTGEKTACFQDRESGKLEEIMLIRDEADMREFLDTYGLSAQEVETVY